MGRIYKFLFKDTVEVPRLLYWLLNVWIFGWLLRAILGGEL